MAEEIEGLAEELAELKTRPGMWRAMGHHPDLFIAKALVDALARGAEETDPGELYEFAATENEEHGFVVYGRFDGPATPTH